MNTDIMARTVKKSSEIIWQPSQAEAEYYQTNNKTEFA